MQTFDVIVIGGCHAVRFTLHGRSSACSASVAGTDDGICSLADSGFVPAVRLRGNGCFPLVLDSMLLPGVAAVFFTCALHGGACRCPGDVGRRISFRV